jgi:thiamine-phosphate pyrophosphorylase
MGAPDHPGLYLITPKIKRARHFMPLLQSALSARDIACVLLRLDATSDSAAAVPPLLELVRLVQSSGAALLVDQDSSLVRQIGADGAHLSGAGVLLADAIKTLKPEYIVGAGDLETRDAAMVAGESGVDYVTFGEPLASGEMPPIAVTLERVAWWSEIFTVPCVGFAPDIDSAAALSASGADFVAFGSLIWDDSRGPAAVVAEARHAFSVQTRSPA